MNKKTPLSLIIIIYALFMAVPDIHAKRLHSKSYYLNKWCMDHAGELNTKLTDGSKCDCETNEYVFELDYSNNWRRAIGRALYYSLETGKRASIVLVIERERERFYGRQLTMLIEYFDLPIDVWTIGDGANDDSTMPDSYRP